MKKRTKRAIAAAVMIVLAAAWIWRYMSLNQLFEENYLPFYVEYAMGEEVFYGENRMVYSYTSDGYTITVKNRELLSFDVYAAKCGFEPSAFEERFGTGTTPDAIVEVTVIIRNADDYSGESYVSLQEFVIHGETWRFGLNGALFLNSNPGWDSAVRNIQLEPGKAITVVLPFCITASAMPEEQWSQLDATDMRLLVTNYPENIEIRLNGKI
ncbi:MAG: hypothetical protein ACI3XJ_02410 [Oscillospiraceae bacterium]